jgi:hypothetical protein
LYVVRLIFVSFDQYGTIPNIARTGISSAGSSFTGTSIGAM